ncbi:type III secretion system gatekeeper subunit SctW [Cedecea sp. FDAARGOS_727]|uniref:type III secretion system gatekeeper subunit SctW n=1 Tax=Cedecea sp. FDAARGOS_727 TaxID=2545798 RepID=UPI00143EBC27|nr:type III secretion system gatekeeper subunit SctW [Cedecea sp. FDAARGOS_727]QIX94542.1 type III secretion system gatekeeper subunit SctW [Cedecea sp. FDAARGOS_727]
MNMRIPQHHHHHNLRLESEQADALVDELLNDTNSDKSTSSSTSSATRAAPTPQRPSAAQESMAATFAESIEQKIKHEEQRTQSSQLRRISVAAIKVTHLVELGRLLESPSGQSQAGRESAFEQLLSGSGHKAPDLDALLELAEGDPASAFVTLSLMAMRLRNGSNPELAAQVGQMLAELQQRHPEKINAGVNTAPAIAAFTSDPAQKRELRKLYYDGVINQQSADNIMDLLLDKFGADGFVPALRTLQRALSDDIAALAPSAPPTALRRLLSGLNDARAITHTLSEVAQFLDRLKSKYQHVTMGADVMTRSLLSMCRNGFYSRDLTQLGLQVVGEKPMQQSLFFNGLLTLLQGLPEKIWSGNDDTRNNALLLLRTLNGEYAAWEKRSQIAQ